MTQNMADIACLVVTCKQQHRPFGSACRLHDAKFVTSSASWILYETSPMSALDRPLLSFIVYAYQQEKFVVEAVQAAFAQTYSPLEVILSDDASQDGTFAVMGALAAGYKGPHSIVLRQSTENLGTRRHLSEVFRIAKGELFVLAAGDDVSVPERATRTWEAFSASAGRARSIMSDFHGIDESGKDLAGSYQPSCPATYDNFIKDRFSAFGATQSVHRSVWDVFGPMAFGYHEDQVLLHRALLLGEVAYIPEKLVRRRRHGTNVSGGSGGHRGSEQAYRAFRQRAEADSLAANGGMLTDYLRFRVLRPEDPRAMRRHVRLIVRRIRIAEYWGRFFGSSFLALPLLVVEGAFRGLPLRRVLREFRTLAGQFLRRSRSMAALLARS